ncbi:hypothetical protein ES705_29223 [subsurface metagenome]
MTITWGDIWAVLLVLVVGSFIAGFVDAWWEQRKREREVRERG